MSAMVILKLPKMRENVPEDVPEEFFSAVELMLIAVAVLKRRLHLNVCFERANV